MSDNKEKETKAQAPKTMPGADADKSSAMKLSQVRTPAKASGWKRFLSKKWVFPATYVAAAAIILAIMWVIQDSGKTKIDKEDLNTTTQNEQQDASPTTAQAKPQEEMQWPANRGEVEISMPFYDAAATSAEKEDALIANGNKFTPNLGVAIARKDQKPFDVLAAMSGKVTRVESVPQVGRLIEITHDSGMTTVYYSLTDIAVAKGDEVKQGDVIAKAGRNELERNLGVHLHFEVLQNGEQVNPENLLTRADANAQTASGSATDDAAGNAAGTHPSGTSTGASASDDASQLNQAEE